LLHPEHGGYVPTFAVGPRLFSLTGESSFRPDLHPGFPTLLEGKDLGVNMMATPTEVYLPDWHARFKANNPDRQGPGYYDLALGVKGEGLPSQDLTDDYIRHLIREGYAEGGAVMMADGGSADFFIDPSSYAQAKSKEMYPKKKSEWTERDAARHMLASGMMAQKFGPTVAKMAGLAHEHFNAPVKTLGYALGIGKMPADYEQDLHNNALGIDLAKRAATQEELERLIKEMTSKSSKTQTEGIPFIGEPKNAARLSDY
jgi:hypothetical protein